MTTIIAQPSSSAVSPGTIAGIVIGSVVGLAVLLTLGVLVYRHQPKVSQAEVARPAIAAAQQYEKPWVQEEQFSMAIEAPSGRLQYPLEVMQQTPTGGRLGQE
jgi:hypothetical protein